MCENDAKLFETGLDVCSLLTFLVGALDGIQYCHDKSIVHRDLTAANLFITADEKIKLAGFKHALKLSGKQCIRGTVKPFVEHMFYLFFLLLCLVVFSPLCVSMYRFSWISFMYLSVLYIVCLSMPSYFFYHFNLLMDGSLFEDHFVQNYFYPRKMCVFA